jgi:hypothetical protein
MQLILRNFAIGLDSPIRCTVWTFPKAVKVDAVDGLFRRFDEVLRAPGRTPPVTASAPDEIRTAGPNS